MPSSALLKVLEKIWNKKILIVVVFASVEHYFFLSKLEHYSVRGLAN